MSDVWRRARAALCPEADPSCKDPSRQYYLPAQAPGGAPSASYHPGALLDPASLPELPAPRPPSARSLPRMSPGTTVAQRGQAYMVAVLGNLEAAAPGGRNVALNRAAWTLGRWVAAGALDQGDVEDRLYRSAIANRLVADDGERQVWATIRSGLSAGLQDPVDFSISP